MKYLASPKLARTLAAMFVIALTLVLMAVTPLSAGAQEEDWVCFPSCDEKDGRALVLAGTGLQSLAGDVIEIELVSPQSSPILSFAVFDGETGVDWDLTPLQAPSPSLTPAPPSLFSLYADKNMDGSGPITPTNLLTQVLGSAMTNNGWYTVTIPNNYTLAQAAGNGNFYYTLRVSNTNPSLFSRNDFKIRVEGTMGLRPQAFAVIGGIATMADIFAIYPDFPNLATTRYNGEWNFYINVTGTVSSLAIWDGDFDFGPANCSVKDGDDADTPNDVLPPWAIGTEALFEGFAVGLGCSSGDPQDDSPWPLLVRTPNVQYSLVAPNGNTYLNLNPSGSKEWEQFRILSGTVPITDSLPITDPNYYPRLADYYANGPFPAGQYRLRLQGTDVNNLNFLRFFNMVQGVDKTDNPASPPEWFGTGSIGDTVWYDINANGVQDPGEPGIPGARVTLQGDFGSNGTVDYTYQATTDASGKYLFKKLVAGTYTATVGADTLPVGLAPTWDFDGIGAGSAHKASTTLVFSPTIARVEDNLKLDFGYNGAGAIGDRVWLDADGMGDQDFVPPPGESGLVGVVLNIQSSFGYTAAKLTNSSGVYGFPNLPPGTYTVTVATPTLPPGAVQTYDPDFPVTPNSFTVTLGGSNPMSRDDVDFGYYAQATYGNMGDTVWIDSDADGKFEPEVGELGIANVTLNLQTNVSRTTASTGKYLFDNILAGSYSVTVDTSTLPPGLTPTWDYDGITTTNISLVHLPGGADNMDVDFGYRPATPPGTGTPGYWKNHPEAWPVDSITIGSQTYTKTHGIDIIRKATERDVTMVMAQALIAAKLNVGLGNPSGCIEQTIRDADAWLALYPVGSSVKGSSAAWGAGEPLAKQLDAYNNGLLCAPSRDSLQGSGATSTGSATKTRQSKQ